MNELPFCPAIAFPAYLNPVIVQLGPIGLHWYGLGYVIGILFAWWYGTQLLKKKTLWHNDCPPMTPEKLGDFVIWAAIGVVVGGRLGQVLFWDPYYYFTQPAEIIAVWDGGMAFHGGLIGTIIAMILFARKNHIGIWTTFDTIAAGVPVGLGIVRICNFINQELWGNVTHVSWAVCFPNDPKYLPRHPSQLYEAFMEGLVLFILLALAIFVFKALRKPGIVSGLFIFGYGVARMISEIFRVPGEDPQWFSTLMHNTGFTYGMALSLPMVLFGIYAMYRAIKYQSS
ncbi:prolipoprotein diacylglyceryl transferase [Bartonella tamiae]|uniref:Phosphatidylglycerol--prolipoprotein diacylglyceryl transferase n=1 Tax=Bartonella tamiae Th239 TaxID=1094558 RepID=J0R0W9_9HYPH|nr:prolipoprotein diacylglyceryl transferase [Bartonella tamiae]EJF89184.1 prolipoprotein diacylglyceryl transferase [Bartonella tamiae Th239]EJF95413.1 prolipoprotein diacylglyceryl transferase [Bartonella tamiae Th307]